jgi:hypothetical protein
MACWSTGINESCPLDGSYTECYIICETNRDQRNRSYRPPGLIDEFQRCVHACRHSRCRRFHRLAQCSTDSLAFRTDSSNVAENCRACRSVHRCSWIFANCGEPCNRARLLARPERSRGVPQSRQNPFWALPRGIPSRNCPGRQRSNRLETPRCDVILSGVQRRRRICSCFRYFPIGGNPLGMQKNS